MKVKVKVKADDFKLQPGEAREEIFSFQARNSSEIAHHCPQYIPLHQVSNNAVGADKGPFQLYAYMSWVNYS